MQLPSLLLLPLLLLLPAAAGAAATTTTTNPTNEQEPQQQPPQPIPSKARLPPSLPPLDALDLTPLRRLVTAHGSAREREEFGMFESKVLLIELMRAGIDRSIDRSDVFFFEISPLLTRTLLSQIKPPNTKQTRWPSCRPTPRGSRTSATWACGLSSAGCTRGAKTNAIPLALAPGTGRGTRGK